MAEGSATGHTQNQVNSTLRDCTVGSFHTTLYFSEPSCARRRQQLLYEFFSGIGACVKACGDSSCANVLPPCDGRC